MTGPSPFTLNNYAGVLRLDDTNQEAWRRYQDASGAQQEMLMVLDRAQSGAFSQQMAADAWDYFENQLGLSNNDPINVRGFVAASGAESYLHVAPV